MMSCHEDTAVPEDAIAMSARGDGHQASVVYVLPDAMGGIASNVADLLRHRDPDAFRYHAILTHNRLGDDARFRDTLDADGQATVEYSLPLENLRAVLRRLSRALPGGPGVLVANDWIELALLSVHDPRRTVIYILHGDYDYYYDLAVKHEPLIDAFVALTRATYEHLQRSLPSRRESIFLLPFGVSIGTQTRARSAGPLRLLFVGRLVRAKGLYDLPLIDELLQELGVARTWTLLGVGSDADELRMRWVSKSPVRWLGLRPRAEVPEVCAGHDVLILPSRAEGLPRAVLEAMSVGLVPVASNLPSGLRDIVEPGVSGYLPEPGDTVGFATAIAALHGDRGRLEAMSHAARRRVVERFDLRERAPEYQALYGRWKELQRPKPRNHVLQYGSRLDRPWLPNPAVYAVRAARRWFQGARA
jgi:glycosyltransferase involved in cell wall biosynthesis